MNENFLREHKLIKEFPSFFWATLGYALFYVLCLYKHSAGISYPIFTIGMVIYFVFCMKKLNVEIKKFSIFYLVCIVLLGISTCLTYNWTIINLNGLCIFFLSIVFLLHNFYENKHWNFVEHIKAFFSTIILSFGFIYKPFTNYINYKKQRVIEEGEKKNKTVLYVILGIIISLPIVVVVLLLLVSADAVFENIFVKMFEDINIFTLVGDSILSSVLFVIIFFVTYMLISFLCGYNVNGVKKEHKKGEPVIAITICAILSFIYVIFCGIQIVFLFFGSSSDFLFPNAAAYSQYAREGFFQLLYVCLINLILVLVGIYLFKESKVLKLFLCIITSCTYIMIASSAMRMMLYIQYNYLTFLRVFVLWALLVILLVMIGVMISIFKKDFNFFKYSTIVVISLYIIFAYARVDYFIAKVNTDNMNEETQYAFFEGVSLYDDDDYLLTCLSYDAIPVIIKSEDKSGEKGYWSYGEHKERILGWILEYSEDLGIRDFNVSRYIAITSIEKYKSELEKKK